MIIDLYLIKIKIILLIFLRSKIPTNNLENQNQLKSEFRILKLHPKLSCRESLYFFYCGSKIKAVVCEVGRVMIGVDPTQWKKRWEPIIIGKTMPLFARVSMGPQNSFYFRRYLSIYLSTYGITLHRHVQFAIPKWSTDYQNQYLNAI